jgi:subtilase family serine protease
MHSRIFLATILAILIAFTYPTFVSADQTEPQMEPYHHIRTGAAPYAVSGLTPTAVKAAYNLPATGGQGTIAIIDAYDNPYVVSDLNVFCTQFGLPAATIEVHKMTSTVRGNTNWGLEIALDVQWAHAIAPNAKILLVEARSNSLSDLLSAVNYAKGRSDVVAISMSWGSNEFSSEASYDSYLTSNYGAAFYASSGDDGAGTCWPSVSSRVISVGGTTLSFANGAVSQEAAWSGSGGGVSTYISKPTYQSGVSYSKRATPDVSYNGDPNSGFAVYDSYGYGWVVVGGTSAGAPQWAAIHSLSLTATATNIYNAYSQSGLYEADFRDITSGSNGYSAGVGYDLATGVGSPLTTDFSGPVTTDFTLSTTPNTVSTSAGKQASTTVNVTPINGFTGNVALSVSAPTNWVTTLDTSSITGSGQTGLTITPPAGATAGTYTVTVTGQSTNNLGAPLSHSATVTVTVAAPNYSLTANPSSLTVRQGKTGTSTITVNGINGYSGAVTLSARSSVSRVTFSFNTNPVSSGSSATLTVNVPSTTARGTYTITVSGVDSSGLTRQTTIRLTVTR